MVDPSKSGTDGVDKRPCGEYGEKVAMPGQGGLAGNARRPASMVSAGRSDPAANRFRRQLPNSASRSAGRNACACGSYTPKPAANSQ